jgi:septal ring factor EnvC (AmiA/AmiB activator)
LVLVVVVLAWLAPVGHAQDGNNLDELKKSLADALNQLKAAQDRKNELATENEKLKAKIAEQEQQLTELRRDAAEYSAKSWQLRSQAAAWESFLKRYPNLLIRWKLFLAGDPLSQPTTMPEFLDPGPLSSQSSNVTATE